eukprot:TRINITY_DN4421_c0_g2_i3.p1 TRINITY_DN4421_c0_g2~~TRINITY_DN4421_c0_g2_i3.p1  ORF type:complete len:1863 (-),score=406.47 TRINITY_DN4421_c0_g2_i3:80-5668(-)
MQTCPLHKDYHTRDLNVSDVPALNYDYPLPRSLYTGFSELRSQCNITGVDWNESFQKLLERPTAVPEEARERSTAISNLSTAFVQACMPLAQTIVLSLHQPPAQRPIVPLIASDSSNTKLNLQDSDMESCYIHDGVFFKVVSTPHDSYTAQGSTKAATLELKGLQTILASNVDHLHVPLTCIVDFAGHRVIAVALPPLSLATTVFRHINGSAIRATLLPRNGAGRDRETSLSSSPPPPPGATNTTVTTTDTTDDVIGSTKVYHLDPHMDGMVRHVAPLLNFQTHAAPPSPLTLDPSQDNTPSLRNRNRAITTIYAEESGRASPTLHGPIWYVVEGHRGTDGRRYLTNQVCVPPMRAVFLLRPELLKRIPSGEPGAPTTAPASTPFSFECKDMDAAASFLYEKIIPDLATELEARYKDVPLTRFRLSDEMHDAGLNMRHLGMLRARLVSEKLRQLALTEMVARAVTRLMQPHMREARDMQEVKQIVAGYFGLVFGEGECSDQFWRAHVVPSTIKFFPGGVGPDEAEKAPCPLRDGTDPTHLMHRLCARLGVTCTPPPSYSAHDSFNQDCILDIKGRTKSMRVVPFVETQHVLGRFDEREFSLLRALDVKTAAMGQHHIAVAAAQLELGELYAQDRAYHDRAKDLLAEAERTLEKAPSCDPSPALVARADLYMRKEKFAKCLALLEQAHAIRTSSMSPHIPDALKSLMVLPATPVIDTKAKGTHAATSATSTTSTTTTTSYKRTTEYAGGMWSPLDVATVLERMAHVRTIQGRYTHALDLAQRAWEIHKAWLGSRDVNVSRALQYEYAVQSTVGDSQAAEEALTIALNRASAEQRSNDELKYLYEMALLLAKQGGEGLNKAKHCYKTLLAKARGGEGAPHGLGSGPSPSQYVASSMAGLAHVYLAQAKYIRAEALYTDLLNRSLPNWETYVSGHHHHHGHRDDVPAPDGMSLRSAAHALDVLAWLHFKRGAFILADQFHRHSASLDERTMSREGHAQLRPLLLLADLHLRLGHFAEAEAHANGALAMAVAEHPDKAMVTCLNMLADIQFLRGTYNESLRLRERAISIAEKALGQHDLLTAQALHDLGFLYYRKGQFSEASSLFERAEGIRHGLGAPLVDRAQSLHDTAYLLTTLGRYSEAEAKYKQALSLLQSLFGSAHPSVATTSNNYAWLLFRLGKFAEAKRLYEESLAVRQRILGTDHVDTARSLHELAELQHKLGAYALAERLNKEALAIRQRILSPSHVDVARSHQALSVLYLTKGNYVESETHQKISLSLMETLLGTGHPKTAEAMYVFGLIMYKTGRYVVAERLYRRALGTRRRALGEGHLDVAASLCSLAYLYGTLGKYEKATKYYRRALAIMRNIFASRRPPDLATAMSGLAWILFRQAKYTQAEHMFTQALEIMEGALGPETPDVAVGCHDLGDLLQRLGRLDLAETMHKRALSIRTTVFGTNHVSVARSLLGTAGVTLSQGKFKDAESLVLGALYIYENTLGPHHVKVSLALGRLGLVHMKQGKYEQALEHYHRALLLQEAALGEHHLEVAYLLKDMAYLYATLARYADAEGLYVRALSLLEGILGGEHPDVAMVRSGIAWVFFRQAKYQAAEKLYRDSLRVREKVLGTLSLDTARSYHELAELYAKNMSKYEEALMYTYRALEVRKKIVGRSPELARSLSQLAWLHFLQGDHEVSEVLQRQSIQMMSEALGPKHSKVAQCLHRLAVTYQRIGRPEEAEDLFQQSLVIRLGAFSATHPDCAQDYHSLAELALAAHKARNISGPSPDLDKSREYLIQASRILTERLGVSHPDAIVVNELHAEVRRMMADDDSEVDYSPPRSGGGMFGMPKSNWLYALSFAGFVGVSMIVKMAHK